MARKQKVELVFTPMPITMEEVYAHFGSRGAYLAACQNQPAETHEFFLRYQREISKRKETPELVAERATRLAHYYTYFTHEATFSIANMSIGCTNITVKDAQLQFKLNAEHPNAYNYFVDELDKIFPPAAGWTLIGCVLSGSWGE